MIEPAQIMVVTAHPDDAEYGAAGTIALWIKEGKDVVYVVCSSGEKGTSDRKIKPEELAQTREQEQIAASRLLGVREVVFLHYSDQGIEDTPEFRKNIVRQIRKYRPEIIITADPYRRYIWHRDHRIVSQVTLDAIFPYARDHLAYPELLDEGLMPHKVKEAWFWATEDPNYHSDITQTFDIKLAALRCHKSQVGDDLAPDLEEWLKQRAREMAKGQNFELAEAFHRVEILW